jgi:hypothetical protein
MKLNDEFIASQYVASGMSARLLLHANDQKSSRRKKVDRLQKKKKKKKKKQRIVIGRS